VEEKFNYKIATTTAIVILVGAAAVFFIKNERGMAKQIELDRKVNQNLQELKKGPVLAGDIVLLGCEDCNDFFFSFDPYSLMQANKYANAKDGIGFKKLENAGQIVFLPNKVKARFIVNYLPGISQLRLLESKYAGEEIYIDSAQYIWRKFF